jgi:oxygen-independent coproporphyrinogen-3 oxidase
MPSTLPVGDPAPADGALPASAAVGSAERDLGVYLHVPFCRVRCGYCDFNTYTASEIRGVKQSDYAGQASAEVDFARAALADAGLAERAVSTVFFGGGTPTLLPAADLIRMLDAVRDAWGLAPGAEVTTEANPDSVTAQSLAELAEAGFTRVSFGMQSAVPHVLATLERTHDPARIPLVVQWARDAGLQVSLDLIYGTPGESLDDWRRSLELALAQRPDHLSAYALIVEQGTKLARQIARGEVARPDEELQADQYELADELLAASGYGWYEVSNWVGRETLDAETRRVEDVLLRSRIVDGLPTSVLDDEGRAAVAGLIADGLIDGRNAIAGRVVLTRRGRLLADAVVRRLLP